MLFAILIWPRDKNITYRDTSCPAHNLRKATLPITATGNIHLHSEYVDYGEVFLCLFLWEFFNALNVGELVSTCMYL